MNLNRLAVYGILKCGFELDLRYYGGRFLGKGTIKGTLYHIGSGVGLRLDDPSQVAHVEVFEIVSRSQVRRIYSVEETWRWLDAIESNGQVYTRKTIPINMEDGTTLDCWIYEHTLWPLDRYKHPIEGGKFLKEHCNEHRTIA